MNAEVVVRVSWSILAIVPALLAPRATAQCPPTWASPGYLLPNAGSVGGIYDATMWDPDGGGPAGEVLVMAGINGVFTWDGVEWARLGDAGQSPTVARHVVVNNGQPVVRGNLAGVFGAIARWNGNGWLLMGSPGGNISDMANFGGEVIIAGYAIVADGSSTNNIARWDGAAWHAMGAGLPSQCTALTTYDLDANGPGLMQLYAGCMDGSIHRWNGATWQTLPTLGVDEINALCGHDGLMFAASRTNPGAVQSRLSTWSEGAASWTPTVGTFSRGSMFALVSNMLSWNGSLIICGHFDLAGGVASANVVRRTAGVWSAMGQGLGLGQPWYELHALAGTQTNLYAVGDFYDIPGGYFAQDVAYWDGAAWSAPVSPGQVLALTTFGSRMAVGGWFGAAIPGNADSVIHHLGLWDGHTLSPLSGEPGSTAGTVNAPVRAMREFTTSANARSLIIGGDFTQAGAVAANRIVKWNQSDTSPLLNGWATMGSGFNGSVHALEVDGNGALVAGGAFTASGATAINRVAKWNGSAWVPYATAPTTDMNGTVRAFKAYLPNPVSPITKILVAGGDFTTANGNTVNRIAMWTDSLVNGTTPWTAMGPGFNGPVYAIERFSSSIYAAGAFTMSGAFNVNKIARWNGTSWLVVGNGIGFNGPIYALKALGNRLYAAGAFDNVDGIAIKNIAQWDGVSWSGLSSDTARYAIALWNLEVHFGGDARYSTVSATNDAEGVERWLPFNTPWLMQQPSSQTRDCGQQATFSVAVADGYDNGVITWRRNGVALSNGVTPQGSTILGAGQLTMFITNLKPGDAGDYDCVYSIGCASVTSGVATLTVINCCPADINGDTLVNVTDLLAVIGAWGACADPNNCPADTNNDDQVNVTDLLAVIGAWGACP